jgi:MOSC domain-containing protein YiiM|tara:strand:- start:3991 stop:4635 length:645 start_codon:yes stop_codon:yes gene_type:complete
VGGVGWATDHGDEWFAEHNGRTIERLKELLEMTNLSGTVLAVSSSATHTMVKPNQASIRVIEGLGVEGDAHQGATVKHRSRVRRNPNQPNLRQVHLIHGELLDDLREEGFDLEPGQMGENVTTRGVDLLELPLGTRLRLGADVLVEVTGLRNPCAQLDGIQPNLMAAVIGRDDDGEPVFLAGVMSVVVSGGEVRPGDEIKVTLPDGTHVPLEQV